LLELRKVDVRGNKPSASLRQASLTLRAGEVIGIAGIEGNGQDALAGVAAGLCAPTSGEVLLFGRRPRRCDPRTFIRAGVGRLPSRVSDGLISEMSVAENLAIEELRPAFTRYGVLRTDAIRRHAHEVTDFYSIESPDPIANPESSSPTSQRGRSTSGMAATRCAD
jgi:simple sugar transport system ATP-binding protein